MARRATQNTLRTMRLPKAVKNRADDAAQTAIRAHVLQFLGAYHGNITELAVGCYYQGLLDAVRLAQEYPGWPAVSLAEEAR